jgi:Ca2+-binding RTX toxin-like protein
VNRQEFVNKLNAHDSQFGENDKQGDAVLSETQSPEQPDFNIITASVGRETILGTDAADAFTFEVGTSVNGAIDTVLGWTPGDVIDLTALGLSADDINVRLVSGGTVLKLIEGFGDGEFHVRINLNGYSVDEVLASIIYDGASPPPPPPPQNTAPTANDDSVETSFNIAVPIAVLANDTDPENDDLSITLFGQAENGTVIDLGNGSLLYVPNEDFVGTDSFTYTISDGEFSSEGTVSVNVAAAPTYNVITGSDQSETLGGTAQADEIIGLDGDDTILGGGGDDLIRGGLGRDRLSGGAGDDVLIGGGNTDELNGDYFNLGPGNDTIIGDPNSRDFVWETSFEAGPVEIDLSRGLVISDGFGGTDTISNVENIWIDNRGENRLIGDDSDNAFIRTGLGGDIIDGRGGDDSFLLDNAVLSIDGGDGTDIVSFWNFVSVLDPANQSIQRSDRSNGVHVDLTQGLIVDDGIGGQTQLYNIENAQGTNFDDTLIGDSGSNSLFGSFGNDFLDGRDGNDLLVSGSGNNTLLGGRGDDRLAAQGDENSSFLLEGGEGADQIFLSDGAATIIMSTGDGADTVASGFDAAFDRIDVSGFGLTAAEALALAQQSGSSTLLNFGTGDSLTINNFSATDLTEDNFIGIDPPPEQPDFNIITASVGRETILGTDAADAFTFEVGTSVNGAIDTVLGWTPGDVIDLTALGLSADDINVRLVSGGTVLKLIEGFGDGEFHVRINLNGYSVDEVLASVIYSSEPAAEATAKLSETLADFAIHQPIKSLDEANEAQGNDLIVHQTVNSSVDTTDSITQILDAYFEPAAPITEPAHWNDQSAAFVPITENFHPLPDRFERGEHFDDFGADPKSLLADSDWDFLT